MPIRCPLIRDPDAGLAPATDFDPLVAWLAAPVDAPAPVVFPRGVVQHDGRLDLCKQGVGPIEAGRITAAAAASPHVRHLLLGTNGLGAEGIGAVAGALHPGSTSAATGSARTAWRSSRSGWPATTPSARSGSNATRSATKAWHGSPGRWRGTLTFVPSIWSTPD